jgi:hypothetical protein
VRALLVISLALLSHGCAPINGDGDEIIINDFCFRHSGGDERSIWNCGPDRWKPHISNANIDARVDSYRVDGDLIYVARLPREIWTAWQKSRRVHTQAEVDEVCEHWVIDTRAVKMWQVDRKSPDARGKCFPLVTTQGKVPWPEE